MITPNQIRAARALKNWSQGELARRTGLTTPTIANIELGKQSPSANTIDKIVEAFAVSGVEFTKTGVELADNVIIFLQADESPKYHYLEHDILSLLSKGDKVYHLGCDDRRSPPEVIKMQEGFEEAGLIPLKIIADNNVFIQGAPENTRCIPASDFTFKDVITIYADKVVTVVPPIDGSKGWTYMIIKNHYLAEDYKRIFHFYWDRAKPLKKWKDVRDYKNPMSEHYSEQELKKLSE